MGFKLELLLWSLTNNQMLDWNGINQDGDWFVVNDIGIDVVVNKQTHCHLMSMVDITTMKISHLNIHYIKPSIKSNYLNITSLMYKIRLLQQVFYHLTTERDFC